MNVVPPGSTHNLCARILPKPVLEGPVFKLAVWSGGITCEERP